jgi:methylase of polypeptide subunit release factors
MSKPLNHFDWLANYYDSLKWLVFGNALANSERHFLHLLPKGCTILMLGGGTGQVLRHIFSHDPNCRVWFVEASGKMLSQAMRNLPAEYADQVQFVYATEASSTWHHKFDVIITNFYLDLYPDKELLDVCATLYERLNARGLWLASDFADGGRWWQRIMLSLMYKFFVSTCRISARRLPDWEKVFHHIGLSLLDQALFYRGFVKSAVFEKSGKIQG